jgi:hypothetical protein
MTAIAATSIFFNIVFLLGSAPGHEARADDGPEPPTTLVAGPGL